MAQGIYTVSVAPVQGRTYENKKGGGNLVVWRLGLKDAESDAEDNLFELHKKEGNAPPGVGDEIEVERTQSGEHQGVSFTRLFTAYTQGARPSGGGGSSSGGDGPGLEWKSAPYEKGAEHPRNEKRVIHTSAMSATPGYIEQMLTIGVADQPKTWDEYWKLVGKVATKLTRSYEMAMSLEPQQPLPVAAQEVPADTAGLEPKAEVADDKIPF